MQMFIFIVSKISNQVVVQVAIYIKIIMKILVLGKLNNK